jgi:hypothetical protein
MIGGRTTPPPPGPLCGEGSKPAALGWGEGIAAVRCRVQRWREAEKRFAMLVSRSQACYSREREHARRTWAGPFLHTGIKRVTARCLPCHVCVNGLVRQTLWAIALALFGLSFGGGGICRSNQKASDWEEPRGNLAATTNTTSTI